MTAKLDLAPQALQRARGRVRIRFASDDEATRLAELFQEGCAKARLPRVALRQTPEAVLINTSGGLADGDVLEQSISLDAGARAIVTTQACERVYRAREALPARVTNTLSLGADARLLWIPQETILFDGGRLHRALDANIDAGARLLVCEATLFGRRAMGETASAGLLRDDWRLRADGRLLHAEAARFGGEGPNDIALATQGEATLNGAAATATVILAAPGETPQIERWVELVRDILAAADARGLAGVSGWGGRLIVRFVAPDGKALRRALMPVLDVLGRDAMDDPAFRLPKVWAL